MEKINYRMSVINDKVENLGEILDNVIEKHGMDFI